MVDVQKCMALTTHPLGGHTLQWPGPWQSDGRIVMKDLRNAVVEALVDTAAPLFSSSSRLFMMALGSICLSSCPLLRVHRPALDMDRRRRAHHFGGL